MTPWEEVQTTGRIGHEGAKLLYKLVYSVATDRNIPAPHGHDGWGRAAIEETAHDFLSGPSGMQRLVAISDQATDNDSFRRQLAAAVLNHLRTLGRATDVGKLIIRLNDILKTTPAFETTRTGNTPTWTVRGGPTTANTIPAAGLEPHIRTVRVERPKWTSETRDAPLADRATMVHLVTRILEAADGAMTARDIADVLALRIDIRRIPLSWELDAADAGGASNRHTSRQPDPASATVADLQARDLFDTLTDREKIMVALSDKSLRDLGPLVGLRHAQAAIVRQRLFDRLKTEVEDQDEPEAVIEVLCDLCNTWVADWTDGDGPTS